MNQKFLDNIKTLENISEKIGEQDQLIQTLQPVSGYLENSTIAKYANLMKNIPTQHIQDFASVYLGEISQLENLLSQKLNNLFEPYENYYNGIEATVSLVGEQFQELVQPLFYLPENNGIYSALDTLSSEISNVVPQIDYTWLDKLNQWQTEVSHLSSIDTFSLKRGLGQFAKLLKLEQETSQLALDVNSFTEITSISAQIASIEESFSNIAEPWRELIVPNRFLEEYNTFAIRQHQLIQKAIGINDEKSVEWRLDLLDATSKFVDRQIKWNREFIENIQEESDIRAVNFTENEIPINDIPRYIGYSKRDSKKVDKALAESRITIITEKGKHIVDKARLIRSNCMLKNREVLFHDKTSYLSSYKIISETYCTKPELLRNVVEALYHLFYEQREFISKLVNLNEFDCINQIYRIKIKQDYPEKTKKISDMQESLYDDFLLLEDAIIEELENDRGKRRPNVIESSEFVGEEWAEGEISKKIFRALQNIQRNSIYWGKNENVYNDIVRDNLGMVYEVNDQSRQGVSPNGDDAGEVDLQLCDDGNPVVMIEGVKLTSVDRDRIKQHIDKVLTCYDPLGCPYAYLLIYVKVRDFGGFWERFMCYIKNEYIFPFELKEEISEVSHIYTDSRHAKAKVIRSGKLVSVHFFAILVQ